MTGAERIAAERARQIADEGYTAAHDDRYNAHSLAWAAACYAAPSAVYRLDSNLIGSFEFTDPWPWGPDSDHRRPCEDGVCGTRSGLGLDVVISHSGPRTISVRVREGEGWRPDRGRDRPPVASSGAGRWCVRPEDRVTNTVADAAAYERWRAQDDPKDDDERGDVDEDRGCPHRCRCHSRSLDPCAYCIGDCCPRSET